MVISSTVITNGRALCLVTGTGMDTEMGRIARHAHGANPMSPPHSSGRWGNLQNTVLCLPGSPACSHVWRRSLLANHTGHLDMFMRAVSGSSRYSGRTARHCVTIVLALGVQRMVRHNAYLSKNSPLWKDLGLCRSHLLDKTGTLTPE